MPKTYPVRNSFNAGEVSELVSQRDDVAKYSSACLALENAMPLVEGGAKKVPGTYFAGATARGGSMFTASIAGTSMLVTGTNYGVIQIGQTVVGPGVSPGTTITGNLTTPGVPIYTTTSQSGNGSQGVTSGDWQFPIPPGTQFRTFTEPTTTALGDMTILCPVAGVPAGATILGVEVTVDLVSEFGSAATVTGVALWNGSQLGTAKNPGTGFTTTPINYSYGSAGDLWGNTSAAILAALPTLALSVSVNVPDGTRIFVGIVQPTVTVTYSYQSGMTPPVPVPGGYVVSVSQTVASERMQTASDGNSRLVPFQFSTAQGAVLEFSQGIVRIWEGATQGSWSLGLALQLPNAIEYNPVTLYNPGDLVLVGPSYSVEYFHLPGGDHGRLTITAPYGSTNAATVPITFTVNTADALLVTATGSSPNQGINIALANASPANNAAQLIQSGIRALGSINLSGNTVDLTTWTVTPDSVYYATPLVVAPNRLPGWYNVSYVAEAVATNQFDQSPNFDVDINTAYWQVFTPVEPPIELITPYLEADLFALDCSTQSADILWIFHASYPPAVIERLGPNSWAYSLSLPGQQSGEPPYRGTLGVVKTGYSALGQSITAITQANPCVVTVAATGTVFAGGSRVYINLVAGMVELNQGEFIVSNPTLNGDGTFSISLLDPDTLASVDSTGFLAYVSGGFVVQVNPLFAAAGDYPACGTLYQERLTVGGSNNNPTQFNGSVQDDYPDFICDPNEADYAIQFTLVSNQVNQLINMIGTPNALLIGTSGGVWVLTASTGSSISQTNIDAAVQSSLGVSALQPQLVNGSAIFVSRSQRIVTFLVFNFTTNTWEANDLTRLNRNITIGTSQDTSGIVQTAFQMEPYPVFWAVRADGQLIGLVFNTQDQVYAWFRVNMTTQGGYIESCAVITGSGQEDQLSVVVRRTINGVTTRFVEYFMPQELFGQLSNAFFVHSGQQLNLGVAVPIMGITQANPPVVTAVAHGFSNGQTVQISGVLGMTQINQSASQAYTVAGVTTNTFTLAGMDTTAFSAYTGGGTVKAVTNTVTGLSYLLGNTVTAVGDNALILLPPTVVTSDSITFPYYSNVITIGIPYQYILQPTNPVLSSQGATTRGMPQKLNRVTLSVYQSMGGQVGTDLGHMYDLNYGPGSLAQTPSMSTKSITPDIDGDWSEESTLFITQDDPLPFTLRGIVFRMSVNQD